jgi:phospholipid/cholesterol/gamma-HCH transport system substrate-binding protein
MPETPDTPAQNSEPAARQPHIAHLEFKARLLLLFTAVLIASSILYLLYARGVFEPSQTLILTTENSEGVVAGMDVTFSGFPIGRVNHVELAADSTVRIVIDVAQKDAHWLRTSSVFTLERGVVGGTNIRAYSGILADPPLPADAVRPVLRGDTSAEIPRVIASAKEVLDNLSAMTAQDAALRSTLANVQAITDKLKGPQGALGVMFGNETDARKLVATLDRTNALLARIDGLATKADTEVFGQDGLMQDVRGSARQLNALLGDTRTSLQKVDAVLVEAQAISANVRGATADLGPLRADVDATLRKVDGMINEINRKWPFARDTEIKLP